MKKVSIKTVGFIALNKDNKVVTKKDGTPTVYKKRSTAKGIETKANKKLDERKVQNLQNRLNAWASKFSS